MSRPTALVIGTLMPGSKHMETYKKRDGTEGSYLEFVIESENEQWAGRTTTNSFKVVFRVEKDMDKHYQEFQEGGKYAVHYKPNSYQAGEPKRWYTNLLVMEIEDMYT